MPRSFRAALAALLLATTTVVGVGAVAAPASAACTTKVVLPAKVGINKPYTEVTVPLSSTCPTLSYVETDIKSRKAVVSFFMWYPARNGSVVHWTIADHHVLGAHTTLDGYAETKSGEVPLTGASTSVRLASKAKISTSRSGSYVTVKGTVTRYSPYYEKFRPWVTAAKVDVLRPDGTWGYVRTLKTGSTGVASTRIVNPKAATYRIRVADVWNTWGSTSVTARR